MLLSLLFAYKTFNPIIALASHMYDPIIVANEHIETAPGDLVINNNSCQNSL